MAEVDAEDEAEHRAAVALNAAERRAAAADQRLADFQASSEAKMNASYALISSKTGKVGTEHADTGLLTGTNLSGLDGASKADDVLRRSLATQYTFGYVEHGEFVAESSSRRSLRLIGFGFMVKCVGPQHTTYVRSVRYGDIRALYMLIMADGQPTRLQERLLREPKLTAYVKGDKSLTAFLDGLSRLFEDMEEVGVSYDEAYKVATLLKGIKNDPKYEKDLDDLQDAPSGVTWSMCVLRLRRTAIRKNDLHTAASTGGQANHVGSDGWDYTNNCWSTQGGSAYSASTDTREVCRGFARQGWCRFGDKCKHIHAPAADGSTPPDSGGRGKGKGGRGGAKGGGCGSGKGKGASKGLCSAFLKKGTCSQGADCSFAHTSMEDVGKSMPESAKAKKDKIPSTAPPRGGPNGCRP